MPRGPRKRPRPAARPKRSPYEQLVYRIWDAIEHRTGHAPFYPGPGELISYCPMCVDGTVRITFIDDNSSDPGFRITSNEWPGHCSMGCSPHAIARVIA